MAENKRLIYWAAGLSVGALVAHAIDVPDHLKEWWPYATFFVVGAAFQFFLGLAMFLRPWRYDQEGQLRDNAERYGRPYYILGMVVTAAIIMLYAITRTTGLPWLGPEAAAEPITPLSLVPVAADVPLVYFLAVLVRRAGKAGLTPRTQATTRYG